MSVGANAIDLVREPVYGAGAAFFVGGSIHMRDGDGFVYVVNTHGYVDEVLESLASLRRHHPSAPVTIITHAELSRQGLPNVEWMELSQQYDGPIVKIECIRVSYKRAVFLDSDTRVIGDLGDLFDVLDGFDMALAHEMFRGWDYKTPAAKAFCELSTGLIAFTTTPQMHEFFAEWRDTYDRMLKTLGLRADQSSFRETLWHRRDLRHATLPSEYHFIANTGNATAWDVRLLHGRQDLAALEKAINRDLGPRVFAPGFGMITSPSGRKARIKVFLRMFRALVSSLRTASPLKSRATPVEWWR